MASSKWTVHMDGAVKPWLQTKMDPTISFHSCTFTFRNPYSSGPAFYCRPGRLEHIVQNACGSVLCVGQLPILENGRPVCGSFSWGPIEGEQPKTKIGPGHYVLLSEAWLSLNCPRFHVCRWTYARSSSSSFSGLIPV